MRVAIDAADKDSMPPSRILEKLQDGSLDGLAGRPQPMSESTFFDILRGLRRARVEQTEYRVEPGQESEEAGAIIRDALSMARRDLARAKHSETASESHPERRQRLALAREAAKLAADCRYWQQRSSPTDPRASKTAKERGTEAARNAPRQTAIGRLVGDRRRAREPASPDVERDRRDVSQSPNGDSANPETQATPDPQTSG